MQPWRVLSTTCLRSRLAGGDRRNAVQTATSPSGRHSTSSAGLLVDAAVAPPVPLVGRDAEVDRLTAFVRTACRDGGALLVTGEPGIGKTELLDAAADFAVEADTRVIRAAGIEFEAGMSFSGLN